MGRTKNVRFFRGGAAAWTFLALAVLIASGCMTTRNEAFLEIDEAARQGRYGDAADQLAGEGRSSFYSDKDKVVYYLDVGMLQHHAGNYNESIRNLNEAERLMEEYFTRSISQAAGSLLLNDSVMDYAGEDYEDIYLNVFKALGFLAIDDFDGAFVEIRRINNKLNLLEDKYQGLAEQYNRSDDAAIAIAPGESRFYNSALARYLSLLMYRADGDYDSARIDYQEMQEAFARQQNIYDFPLPIDESVLERPDDAYLNVIAFAGRSPVKRASTLYVITGDDQVTIITDDENASGQLIPESYTSFYFPGIEGGYRFKFQLPHMELQGTEVTRIRVVVDGTPKGDLAMMEDMQQVALDTFQVRYPIVFLKTVTRTIVKGVLAEKGKQQMEDAAANSGSALGLAAGLLGSIATDIAVDASEQADLRLSRFFPAFAYTGEWDIAPGDHRIEIEYFGRSGLVFTDDLGTVSVDGRGLNLFTSFLNR